MSFPRNTEDMALIELLIHDRAGCGSHTTAAITGKSGDRNGPPKMDPTIPGKLSAQIESPGMLTVSDDLIRPPVAHAHPDVTAKVVADDAADSGDPPTETRTPVKE